MRLVMYMRWGCYSDRTLIGAVYSGPLLSWLAGLDCCTGIGVLSSDLLFIATISGCPCHTGSVSQTVETVL